VTVNSGMNICLCYIKRVWAPIGASFPSTVRLQRSTSIREPGLFRILITMSPHSEFASEVQALADQLEHLGTTQDKMDVVASFVQDSISRGELSNVTFKPGIQPMSDHSQDDEEGQELLMTLLQNHGLEHAYFEWVVENAEAIGGLGTDETLERLPCANVEAAKNWRCTEDGTLACSQCKLVSYCSKVGLQGQRSLVTPSDI
jgi:hypothetical protein